MTNDELLLKVIERIQKGMQGVEEQFEINELESGDERDDFDKGYLAGMKSVLFTVKFIQDGSVDL